MLNETMYITSFSRDEILLLGRALEFLYHRNFLIINDISNIFEYIDIRSKENLNITKLLSKLGFDKPF